MGRLSPERLGEDPSTPWLGSSSVRGTGGHGRGFTIRRRAARLVLQPLRPVPSEGDTRQPGQKEQEQQEGD